jgi:adenosylcobinamide-GDP ribazoletransferase
MLPDAVRLAVGMLTALRVGPPRQVDRRVAGSAMALAPLAVLPLAAAVTVVALAGARTDLPTLVVAFLAIAALALGSRAFHLDGLSDTVDGLTSSYDRERSLEVMRSGTAGPAGVVAVVLVLGTQVAALGAVLSRPRGTASAVLAGVVVCASRAALALCCLRGVAAARADGLGRAYTGTVRPPVTAAVWLVCAAALAGAAAGAGLPWWRGVLAAAVMAVVVGLLLVRTGARLGGVSGDVLGAAIELALTAGLVVLS